MMLFRIYALFCCAALLAGARDLSGIWVGSMEVKNSTGGITKDPAYIVLKQTGNQVTGTAGDSPEHQFPILDGALEGGKARFHVTFGPTIYFELNQSGHALSGKVRVVVGDSVQSGTIELASKSAR
jgi:hypothetical protein